MATHQDLAARLLARHVQSAHLALAARALAPVTAQQLLPAPTTHGHGSYCLHPQHTVTAAIACTHNTRSRQLLPAPTTHGHCSYCLHPQHPRSLQLLPAPTTPTVSPQNQSLRKHKTKHTYTNIRHTFSRVSPFSITIVKTAHKAKTCWSIIYSNDHL